MKAGAVARADTARLLRRRALLVAVAPATRPTYCDALARHTLGAGGGRTRDSGPRLETRARHTRRHALIHVDLFHRGEFGGRLARAERLNQVRDLPPHCGHLPRKDGPLEVVVILLQIAIAIGLLMLASSYNTVYILVFVSSNKLCIDTAI